MRAAWFLIVLVGCKEPNPDYCRDNPGAAGCPMDDSMGIDADDGIDARLDFGAGDFAIHVSAGPAMSNISFNPGATLNTDADMLCQPVPWTNGSQPAACMLYAKTISIQDGLEVIGTRPVVMLASSALMVNGLVDVASHVTGKVAPGSPSSACKAFGMAPASNGSTGGGGAGGSFVSLAGNGGAGGGQNGGTAAAADTLTPNLLRAGCDGQGGANGSMPLPGAGGHGGGAIYLVAGGTITLSGTAIINASGSGGGQAMKSSGGGGGGSGGMIVLFAQTIMASGARLAANGGSGATGAGPGAGTVGNDPDPNTPLTQAAGPTGAGGSGGAGFAGGNDATSGGSSSNGGGGGGGASGSIQSNMTLTGATSSPAALPL